MLLDNPPPKKKTDCEKTEPFLFFLIIYTNFNETSMA